jgi:hypothetical protein
MSTILQFKVELLEISPPIWRRIQVPGDYTFWDLHVAIQDSMGWTDTHLHAFEIDDPKKGPAEIGIPDPDGETNVIPGWKRKLSKHFTAPGDQLAYEYDFGDSWRHSVLLELVSLVEPGVTYPCCSGGERKCPPEDCGGPPGFEAFLEAISDPGSEEHEGFLEWCGGSYDPTDFDPRAVEFDDPKERLESLY